MSSHYRSRAVTIGGKGGVKELSIGGNSPISLQTMWKEALCSENLQSISQKIAELEQLGCDILRFAIPDHHSAEVFTKLCDMTTMPLVADIHFDYTLALHCMEGNVAKVRINPGNIGSKAKIKAVTDKALQTKTAIRIGVNTGSLPIDLYNKAKMQFAQTDLPEEQKKQHIRATALVDTALQEVAFLEEQGFSDIIVSMKASSVYETVMANELFAQRSEYPLHVGVTEAGPLIAGIVKSSLALAPLLAKDIVSTVRVSLSDSMESEIMAGMSILTECGKRPESVRLVSCPRCGRVGFDVHQFTERWQKKLYAMQKNITVAVMGCIVNGPGEGRHADLGITGAGDFVILFRKGKVVQKISLKNLSEQEQIDCVDAAFKKELLSL